MKLLLLLSLCFLLNFTTFSQKKDSTKIYIPNLVIPTENKFKPDVLPVSPTAAAFQKFVDVPVGLNTGVFNVNISLYTIEVKEIKIPISLNYHAGGHRVEDLASWIGLGWNLQATGVINRGVRGKIDNSHLNPAYWYKNQFANTSGSNYEVFLNPEVLADYQKLNQLAEGKADPSPDIYTFNFLGYSGKFIMTDTITMIPLQPFKIRPLINTGGNAFDTPTGFEIITDDGTKYTFSATEYARIKNESITYATSFYLSTIKTQTGTFISFDYTDYEQNNRSLGYSESSYYQKIGNNYNQVGSLTSSTSSIRTYGKTLSKITFPNGTIEFITQNDRTDYGEARLEKILVKDANSTVVHKFKLNNDGYFTDGGNPYNVRLKLASLIELDPSQTQETVGIKHTFLYEEDINLPERYSKSIDHWGFYNGKYNLFLTPPLLPANSCIGLLDYSGRLPDINYGVANILKSIVYPTGGVSIFDYEANDYLDLVPSQTTNMLSVSATTGQSNEEFLTITQPSQCDDITVDINRPSDEEAGATKTCQVNIYRIEPNNQRVLIRGYNAVTQNGIFPLGLDVGNYVFVARCNIANSYASVVAHYVLNSTPTTNTTAGGLRAKKITMYDALNHANDLTKTFDYRLKDDATKSSGVLFAFPDYVSSSIGFSPTPTSPSCTFPECCGDEIQELRLSSGNIISSGSDNIVGYKDVTVRVTKPTESYKEVSSFTTDGNSFTDSDISWKRGLLIEQVSYNANNQMVHKKENFYNTLPIGPDPDVTTKSFWGLKVLYDFKHPCSFDNVININFPRRYAQTATKSTTEWQILEKTIETIYSTSGATSLSQETRYYYDNFMHKQLSQIVVKTSKNEKIITVMSYPNDYTDAVSLCMVAKNILNTVLEKEKVLLNLDSFTISPINYQRTTFQQYQNDFYLPSKIETKVGDGTLQTVINFLGYDIRGNLNGFKTRDGQTVTLDWYTTADLGKTDLLKSYAVGGGNNGSVLYRTMFYDYKPLVGLSLTSDINDYETTYQYDGFNRLKSIKDAQNYLLKDLNYHYANQIALSGLGLTPTNTLNYIISRTAREAQTGTTLSNSVENTTSEIQYMDGLGRAIQSQIWQGTPDKTKDLITATTEYNAYGNAYKGILPTPSDGILGAYKSNAQALAGAFHGDSYPYTETVFESSSLNRPFKQFGAGQAWREPENEKFVEMEYKFAGTDILQFNLQSDGSVNASTTYPENSLYNSVTTSERGFWTKELKDKQGRIVAKIQQLYADTIAVTGYCYNNANQLIAVISPEAYKKFGTGAAQITSFTENDEIFKELIFGYHYDQIGRQIERHVPGAGWTRYCYDLRDNLILENDDKDAASSPNYYKFTKFDALNRPVYSGLINNIGAFSRSQIQIDFDNFNGQNYETVDNNGLFGYTNVSFPSGYTPAEANGRLIMHYDDYAWQTDVDYNFQTSNAFHAQANAKGMTTGTIIRNLETNDWYRHINYYDYKGRIIQQFSQNHVGGIDRTDYQYRFNGEVLKMRITHKKAGVADIVEEYIYQYNHVGRKVSFKHTLNGVTKNVAKYSYDATGRLKQKELSPSNAIGSNQNGFWTNSGTWQGGNIPTISDQVTINTGHAVTIPSGQVVNAGSLFDKGILQNFGTLNLGNLAPNISAGTLQTVDFSYHIRGLRGINLDASGNLTNKLFSMRLGYEDAGFFDGNIGKQEWKSSLDGKERSFTFSFDGASRILGAFYAGNDGENYSLENISYDANGNILSLSRKGKTGANSYGYIDQLSYIYESNSNKIKAVNDAQLVSNPNVGDFRDSSSIATQYIYNQDGSLNSDDNKRISFEWNYLKKPKKITKANGQWQKFMYDTSGNLLQTLTSTGKKIDYLGNLTYENDILYQIAHDEGRIINGNYEYDISDHAGNLRLSFKDSLGIAKIVTKLDYDPWGLRLKGLDYYNSGTYNKFKTFSGKQLHDDFGFNLLSYKFRFHDPALGRFISIDPLSEEFYSHSPYNYGLGNPIRFIDPDGAAAMDITLLGANNSSVTVKTDLIDIKVNASGLGVDFGGNYTLQGDQLLGAALDIVGIFDPTGIADAAGAKLAFDQGDYLSAGISALGVVPYAGDLAKVGKIEKDVKIIGNAVDALKGAENAKGGVYALKDANGVVKRTGRTGDLAGREAQHKVGKETKGLEFDAVYKTDNYAEQRGLEHMLYDTHKGTAAAANGGLNKIKAIGDKNLNKPDYLKAAAKYLGKQ